jgi:purine nucleosidase
MRIAECAAAIDYSAIRDPQSAFLSSRLSFFIPLMRPVIFDTDIGTDVDDILALVLLAKAPELQLIGVTTVYGDTVLRARIAQVTCDLLQRKEIAVVPGERQTLTGRQIFWAGQEGYGIPGLDKVRISESISAVQYLIETSERYGNDLEVLATGPLTNIAAAIAKGPKALSRIKHLYLMGGAFWMDRYEHNIRCDPEAARIVFASGIPITAIGLDLTLRVRLDRKDVEKIAQIGGGLGPLLEDQISRWWELWQVTWNHPHDPLAALTMVRPDLFIFETWDVEIAAEGRREGLTRLMENKNSNIRIGFDVLARTAEKEIVRRIAE